MANGYPLDSHASGVGDRAGASASPGTNYTATVSSVRNVQVSVPSRRPNERDSEPETLNRIGHATEFVRSDGRDRGAAEHRSERTQGA